MTARELLNTNHDKVCPGELVYTGNGAHCKGCLGIWVLHRDSFGRILGYVLSREALVK